VRDAHDFDVQAALPLLGGRLQQGCGHCDSGVGHHHVHAPEPFDVRRHRILDLPGVGDVQQQRQSRASVAAQRCGQSVELLGGRGRIGHRHRQPVRGQPLRDRASDAAQPRSRSPNAAGLLR